MICKYKTKKGVLCKAHAMKNSNFCYFHNPKVSIMEKRNVRARGGKGNSTVVINSLPDLKIHKSKDVVNLLADTIEHVRKGDLDIRIANCIGYLSGHLIKAFETSDLEKRLEEIENNIKTDKIQIYK